MNLKSLNVQELNTQEMRKTEGGFLGVLAAVIFVVAAVIFATDDNPNTKTEINGNRVGN